jgi:hypothetical protein
MAHLKILDRYFKNTHMSNLIKTHPVGAKSFHVGGQPDKNDEAILIYISNKMQRYTVYFIRKLLYMFRVVTPPIVRSANNCIYSIWYLLHRYCYLPLSWKRWNWFQRARSNQFQLFHDSWFECACSNQFQLFHDSWFECACSNQFQLFHNSWFECACSNQFQLFHDSSNGVTNTRCCRYSCLHSWRCGGGTTRNM